jgi:hypothetical protein
MLAQLTETYKSLHRGCESQIPGSAQRDARVTDVLLPPECAPTQPGPHKAES